MARDALGGSDQSDEVFGNVHRLDRAEAHALKTRVVENGAQKTEQIGARKQIAAVTA